MSLILLALAAVGSASTEGSTRCMGGPVEPVQAPNGAVVNAEILAVSSKIGYTEPTVEEVVDGVWVVGGHSLANTTVIEGAGGLLVYDTGDTREEAAHIREGFEAEISNLPIKVII